MRETGYFDQVKYDLICGDCLDVMRDIPTASVDMILTDLPYGSTKNEWDCAIDLSSLWWQYERVIKENGVIALWAQSPFDKILACSNLKLYRYEWVIEKTSATGFLNAHRMPMKAHEQILIFYRKLPEYHPQMEHGHVRKVSTAYHKRNSKKTTNYGDHALTSYDSTDRYPRDVLRFKWDKQKSALHPTQKPVAALEYMIRTYTSSGQTVLDSCFGSNSTGVAAYRTGRDYIGIEKDPEMFEVGRKRFFEEVAYGDNPKA